MENVRAVVILEILGRPQEYVKEAADALVKKIGEEKGIKIKNSKIADLKKLENNLFSTFAELELEAENILVFIDLIFRYMPAHVEILEPAKLSLENFDLNNMLNGLVMKLHRYDELAKILSVEKNILVQQLVALKKKFGGQPLKMPQLVMKSKEEIKKEKVEKGKSLGKKGKSKKQKKK